MTQTGEKESSINSIRSSIHRILGRNDLDVFVPAVSQKVRDESHTFFFMDGYVFIEYVEGVSYLRLRDTSFFKDVLCQSNARSAPTYSLLNDSDLDPMRAGLKEFRLGDFKVGDLVRVVTGAHKNLRGEVSVVYDDGDLVQVSVNHLRSKRGLLIDFPATFLERTDE